MQFVAGTYGDSQRPSPFLCLAFKLLQLGPGDDILKEYLEYGGEKFKYLRALACFYVRLTRPAKEVYETLEPFLEDARKLRRRGRQGTSLTFMDQFVDELLTKERVCATSLWKMPKREVLEDLEVLEPRVSALGDIEALLDEEDDVVMVEGQGENGKPESDVDEGSEEGEARSPEREMSNESDGRIIASREDDERSGKGD